ncbi:Histone H2AX [Bienertia sinuspersici]
MKLKTSMMMMMMMMMMIVMVMMLDSDDYVDEADDMFYKDEDDEDDDFGFFSSRRWSRRCRCCGGGRGENTPFVTNHSSPNLDADGDDEPNEQPQQTDVNLDASCSKTNDNTSMSHGEIGQKRIRIQDNNALIYLESKVGNISEGEFAIKAAKRLKDMHYDLTTKRGVCPLWMPEDVYEQLLQTKKNKRRGSLSNKVEPRHCQGSVFINEYSKRMEKENGGILPKAVDVYLRTHSKEEPGKGKQLVGSKAKQVMGEYDKEMSEYKDKGIDKEPNEVYFEAIGGQKKGLIPGLWSAGDLYYEKPSSRAGKSSNTYTPSLLSKVSARLEQSQQQHESERAEWERQRAEWERERLEMQKTMQGYSQMFSQCGGSFPFTHPRDPP